MEDHEKLEELLRKNKFVNPVSEEEQKYSLESKPKLFKRIIGTIRKNEIKKLKDLVAKIFRKRQNNPIPE